LDKISAKLGVTVIGNELGSLTLELQQQRHVFNINDKRSRVWL